jgi:hypothetical protein
VPTLASIAHHEAGHVIAAAAFGWQVEYAGIRPDLSGYTSPSLTSMGGEGVVWLAGASAECLYFGCGCDHWWVHNGGSSDLGAFYTVAKYLRSKGQIKDTKTMKRTNEWSELAGAAAKAVLVANADAWHAVAESLLAEYEEQGDHWWTNGPALAEITASVVPFEPPLIPGFRVLKANLDGRPLSPHQTAEQERYQRLTGERRVAA